MSSRNISRPAIPTEVVRQILIESGHRCSVCGDACPLERAHIVPWSKTRDHTAENLMCMCANCHQRADLEVWGESTMREYKRSPWVMRKAADQIHAEKKSTLEFTIALKLTDYTENHKKVLEHSLAAFLDTSPENVTVVSIKSGSVKVTVRLNETDATKIMKAVEANDPKLFEYLDPLLVTEVRSADPIKTAESSNSISTSNVRSELRKETQHSVGSSHGTTKLLVGNLSFNTTENDLQDAFAMHGTVLEANLMVDRMSGRPRGFGFVTMASPEEAQKAIQAMHGADLDGRALTVNVARPREERPHRSGGGGGGGGGFRGDRGDHGDRSSRR